MTTSPTNPAAGFDFDPDAAAVPSSGLFGLPHATEARVHVIEVPFDATTSYRRGTAFGPQAVARASHQVDLHDRLFGDIWREGLHLIRDEGSIADWNQQARALAEPILVAGGRLEADPVLEENLTRIDNIGSRINAYVRRSTESILAADRIPASWGVTTLPLCAIQAAAEHSGSLGILHVDAHADLRPAYEGFQWSHASIMHNVLEQVGGVTHLIQVGVRDLGQVEARRITEDARITTLFDDTWAQSA